MILHLENLVNLVKIPVQTKNSSHAGIIPFGCRFFVHYSLSIERKELSLPKEILEQTKNLQQWIKEKLL
jgi:hypothetical protein